MTKDEQVKGKQFGFWLNGKQMKELNIVDEINEKFEGNISAYMKYHLITEKKRYIEALTELYQFMDKEMVFPDGKVLSDRDNVFLEKIEELIKNGKSK